MVLGRRLGFSAVPRKAICAKCGASFECGGSSACWCSSMGRVGIEYDDDGKAKGCLCKECLRVKTKAQ